MVDLKQGGEREGNRRLLDTNKKLKGYIRYLEKKIDKLSSKIEELERREDEIH